MNKSRSLNLVISFISILLLTLLTIGSALAQNEAKPYSVSNQGWFATAVTPNDSVNLTRTPTKALYIGNATACNIAVILQNDTVAVTFLNVQSGSFLPLKVKRVMLTNTNCSNIVALN